MLEIMIWLFYLTQSHMANNIENSCLKKIIWSTLMKYTSSHRNILEVRLKLHLEWNPTSAMCSSKETEIKTFSPILESKFLYFKLHDWRENHDMPIVSTADRSLSLRRTRQLSRLQVSEYYLCLHWSLYKTLCLLLPVTAMTPNTNWNWIRSLNFTL